MADLTDSEYSVLLVDDEDFMLRNYKLLLHSAGIKNMLLCGDSRDVIPLLSRENVGIIVLDLIMPHISGEDLLPVLTRDYPEIPVIIITALNDTETVVRCIKKGAFDFIGKPVERNRLLTTVKRTLEFKKLERENTQLKNRFFSKKLNRPGAFSHFHSINEKMHSIFHYMEVIANSLEPILITGETGVGKELAARTLKELAPGNIPFVPVNAAGLDDQLFTDTLFGHVKGGFTDALRQRRGQVEQAEGGILFLDEIGDLSIPSQVKLLRLLQENEYYPIRADVPRRCNARIIAATNKDLLHLKLDSAFRNDLFYRLCVHHIAIPPLRERPEDLPMLVDYFIEEASRDLGINKPAVPAELFTLLSGYRFPGNIRELRTMVFNAVSKHRFRKMSLEAFKDAIKKGIAAETDNDTREEKQGTPAIPLLRFSHTLPTLKHAAKMLVSEALTRTKGNQSMAAELLGVTRQALNKRLKGFSPEEIKTLIE